jgi:hypothetical protein
MASTPASSFSSEEGHIKGRVQAVPFKLPSPAHSRSDSETHPDCPDTHDGGDCDDCAQKAYDTIWNKFCGPPTLACPTFHLYDQSSYERLHQKLEQHPGLLEFFKNEVRKDWNAATGKLTLRLMASYLHDVFKESFGIAIQKELDRVARAYPALLSFREKIIPAGHGKVQKGRGKSGLPYFERSPDGQLMYQGAKYPHFLFEVGYSQDERSLRRIVTEYFEEVVETEYTFLTFDIDYAYPPKRKVKGHYHPASVSLWVSEQDFGCGEDYDCDVVVKNLMDTVVFRDKAGNAMQGELVLPFKLFVPAERRGDLPDEALAAAANINIPFGRLSELVNSAEQLQRECEADAPALRVRKVRWLDTDGAVTRDTMRAPPSPGAKAAKGELSVSLVGAEDEICQPA